MMRALPLIRDVAERQLCCGCGVCAYMSPVEIKMVDTLDHGRRPLMTQGNSSDPRSAEALAVCPGVGLRHTFPADDPSLLPELTAGWGPVRELWEGFASDSEIRFSGSSGGAASALALYGIERGGLHGLLHIAARPDVPYLNQTVMSTTRGELLAATGSRYAPASPCDRLDWIERAPSPCVFIGKPCDVAAVHAARRLRPALDAKVGLTIAIFCAGTPTTKGTLALLERMGLNDPATLVSLRYRGNGWPGRAVARVRTTGGIVERELSYEQSWGEVLTNHQQWRCNLCPDHTGEFADISVGDPWYRTIPPGEPGRSLVVVRTERGRHYLQDAIRAGYLELTRVTSEVLPASQPNLYRSRGSVWGRLVALSLLRIPRPAFAGIPMFHIWWKSVPFRKKVQSLGGVLKRVFRRGLLNRHRVIPFRPAGAPVEMNTGTVHDAGAPCVAKAR